MILKKRAPFMACAFLLLFDRYIEAEKSEKKQDIVKVLFIILYNKLLQYYVLMDIIYTCRAMPNKKAKANFKK